MAMTAALRNLAARRLGRMLFLDTSSTAKWNHDELLSVIVAIDNGFDVLPPALNQTNSILTNLTDAVEGAYPTASTTQEKALALICWAQAKGGVL